MLLPGVREPPRMKEILLLEYEKVKGTSSEFEYHFEKTLYIGANCGRRRIFCSSYYAQSLILHILPDPCALYHFKRVLQ